MLHGSLWRSAHLHRSRFEIGAVIATNWSLRGDTVSTTNGITSPRLHRVRSRIFPRPEARRRVFLSPNVPGVLRGLNRSCGPSSPPSSPDFRFHRRLRPSSVLPSLGPIHVTSASFTKPFADSIVFQSNANVFWQSYTRHCLRSFPSTVVAFPISVPANSYANILYRRKPPTLFRVRN